MKIDKPFNEEVAISSDYRKLFLYRQPTLEHILDEVLPLSEIKFICLRYPTFVLTDLMIDQEYLWWQSRIRISGFAIINDPRFIKLTDRTYQRAIPLTVSRFDDEGNVRAPFKSPEPRYIEVKTAGINAPRIALTTKTLNDYLGELVTQSSKEYLEWKE